MYMLLRGVECCHTQQILHRVRAYLHREAAPLLHHSQQDIKPSNLLLDQHGVLKLSDFGLATVYTGPEREYAHQVATRWYRSPELLFGSRTYNHKVDMWAVGVVFAELLQHAPLFPGMNDIDQIFRVMQVLGSPTWPGMADLPDYHKVSFPVFSPLPLETLFADTDSIALDLLKHLLVYDPSQRLDAAEVCRPSTSDNSLC
ncbi:hypothetical protein DYB32_007068 [Aphanomyces invadans]|uniref:Cyclin-dependent kinase 2 homolog n=1 Tax=Aphanomyces invadans TaxID=157072 RepID=A0A418API5_9STRA|nr:hypothetical protein DYB32_007068 [Aphanomyces invadans]